MQWHNHFDLDSDLIAAGDFGRPTPLSAEISVDTRLIFGLSRATAQTRQKCFEPLPEGQEMWRRFEDFLSSDLVQMTETDAHAGLAKVSKWIEEIGPNETVSFSTVRILDRDTDKGLSELANTDDLTVLLERAPSDPDLAAELPKTAANRLLTEPMYATAGNYYPLRNWVTSAMTGGLEDKRHT